MASKDEQTDLFLNSDAIGDDFFIGIVEKKLNIKRDTFKLRLVLLSPATGKNENFVSVVYRAKIKIEIIETKLRQSVDVIIKALLSTMKEFKELSVFPRECFVYENILDSYEKIWLDQAGEEILFGPKSIQFETDPYEIIVLDDLKASNYEMLDRIVGLNMFQAKLLLTKLAKFHAASAVRYQKDGIIQGYFDRKALGQLFPEDSPMMAAFERMYSAFVESVNIYGDCCAPYKKLARWNVKSLSKTWIEIANPMRCGFQVMNHGDIWLNNMMFKFDKDNNPVDVSMIDYQGPFWGSPAADILYFLISSVSDDIKVDCFDDFIDFYHEQLTIALKKLNYDQHIPSLSELHIDLLDKGAFACSCLMLILFVVKKDSPQEINIEQVIAGSTEDMKRLYTGECYKKSVKLWLHFLNKRGFLDTLITEDEPKKDNFDTVTTKDEKKEENVTRDEKKVEDSDTLITENEQKEEN